MVTEGASPAVAGFVETGATPPEPAAAPNPVAPPLYWPDGAPSAEDGRALWLAASDGRRLRAALWMGGTRGTAVLFQGRTEFIEKYAEPIARFRKMGFNVATLDWRGQGLSERALPDRRKGYVGDFAEFQRDVDALLAHLQEIEAPKPWVLVAHSMGGAIAARALMRLNSGPAAVFAACVMSAPLLQLYGSPGYLSATRMLTGMMVGLGRRKRYALGCDRRTAVDHGFDYNFLTSDPKRFEEYSIRVRSENVLALGGPTWGWLHAALKETAALEPTRTPTLILIGTDDQVVSLPAVQRYASDIERGQVVVLPRARHEPFLETDAVQERLWEAVETFLKDCDL